MNILTNWKAAEIRDLFFILVTFHQLLQKIASQLTMNSSDSNT